MPLSSSRSAEEPFSYAVSLSSETWWRGQMKLTVDFGTWCQRRIASQTLYHVVISARHVGIFLGRRRQQAIAWARDGEVITAGRTLYSQRSTFSGTAVMVLCLETGEDAGKLA